MKVFSLCCLITLLFGFSHESEANTVQNLAVLDSPITVNTVQEESIADSSKDSIVISIGTGGWIHSVRHHSYLLTGFSEPRQQPDLEPLPFMDFNRATGYYLGLTSDGLQDFGPDANLGLGGGFGYGFADKRWEYALNGEYRIPLEQRPPTPLDSTKMDHVHGVPTLSIGGGFHNETSTSDDWRIGRSENAAFAFFAREDDRDYYKLAGWDGYLSIRPVEPLEVRLEWRSDHYQSLSQEVFYGRWGGNKVLPPNPEVAEGRMNSLVLFGQFESVHTRSRTIKSLIGDSAVVEQLDGRSYLIEAEFGHMPGSDFGFNKFTFDLRRFRPILSGLSLDARFRYEAETGDNLFQKLSFIGGPGTLPALYRKSLIANRMIVANTEVRINLSSIVSYLEAPDMNLVIFNDFAILGVASPAQSIVEGFEVSSMSNILYNVGAGIGFTNGLQIGATWRTDIAESPTFLFRLQRAF